MNGKNIFDRVEDYIKDQEVFGKNIYFEELPKQVETVPRVEKKPKAQIAVPKLEEIKEEPSIKKVETKIAKAPIDAEWMKAKTLDELNEQIHDCMNCALGETRNKFVFGHGNPKADIMVIGEAPGADEDKQGLPFVGRAGQLLTKILAAINLPREEVFIGNIIKCRPPGNRRPQPAEVEQCEPYLMRQIELIDPAFILVLGLTAVDTLLKAKHKMGEMRGKVLDFKGRKMMITYHPSALLRNPNWKKPVWQDVKLLRKLYDEYLENKK